MLSCTAPRGRRFRDAAGRNGTTDADLHDEQRELDHSLWCR